MAIQERIGNLVDHICKTPFADWLYIEDNDMSLKNKIGNLQLYLVFTGQCAGYMLGGEVAIPITVDHVAQLWEWRGQEMAASTADDVADALTMAGF
jgi:hypothetical protein